MAQVSLTVLQSARQTNVKRFVLDTKKIVGLTELTNGAVVVYFNATGVVEQIVVDETYDEIFEAMVYGNSVPGFELVD